MKHASKIVLEVSQSQLSAYTTFITVRVSVKILHIFIKVNGPEIGEADEIP